MTYGTSPSSGGGGDVITTDPIATVDGAGGTFGRAQAVKVMYGATTDLNSVTPTQPLPTGINATPFVQSASNTSSANLAPGQIFTGGVYLTQSQPTISINVICDQPTKLTLYQSTDAAGLSQIAPITMPIPVAKAGFGTSVCWPSNSNYFWVTVQNMGPVTTKTCVIDCGSGWLWPTTAQGNMPMAVNEVGGVQITNGVVPVGLQDPTGASIGYGVSPVYVDSAAMRTIANMDMQMALLAAANNQFSAGFVPVEIPGFLA